MAGRQFKTVASKPKPLALKHEIFIFDANLLGHLNEAIYKKSTQSLINDLLKVLKMETLGPLEIFMACDKRAPGWSFIQPITTSHISGHYFESPGKFPHIHIDIYSCCSFKWKKVVEVLDKHLKLRDWSANQISRHTEFASRKIIGFAGIGKKILQQSTCFMP